MEKKMIEVGGNEYIVLGDSKDASEYEVFYKGINISKNVRGLIVTGGELKWKKKEE